MSLRTRRSWVLMITAEEWLEGYMGKKRGEEKWEEEKREEERNRK